MRWILLLVLLAATGCGDSKETDAGVDDGQDAVDAGPDGEDGADPGPDGNGDPEVDAGDPDDPEPDAGADSGPDAGPDAADAAPCDGSNPADEDPGEDFGLWIPACTTACSYQMVRTEDFDLSMLMKARVSFRPGLHRLPKDQASFGADWIGVVEVGPDGDPATPAGAGTVTLQVDGAGADQSYQYRFTQGFNAGIIGFDLGVTITFDVVGGVPLQEVVAIDEDTLTHQKVFITAGLPGYTVNLSSCTYSLFYCQEHTLALAGGSELKLENCTFCPLDWICKADPGGLKRARFDHGGETREVFDFFRLAHSMRHHNWGADFLVVFDDRVDGIHAIHVGSNVFPDLSTAEVTALDESWLPLTTFEVTGWSPFW
jgi:hypothetical protein